ncbi:Metallo-dependent phosphatase-like protein [Chytriomyces cf. hyalinus JEL632]|nr:Metallo-dependent phosphatase-like protein [Chytriomyces cf. hyalinus JEL632]
MTLDLPVFPTSTIRVVCTSDTHNDNPSASVPSGDIFIHAGDMTDFSTLQELTAVLDWVSSLPHKVKILIAGNRDNRLDQGAQQRFSQECLDLMTSLDVKEKGIYYLDREVKTVAYYHTAEGQLKELKVYANPLQPEFSPNRWPLSYPPYPAPEATDAWATAPGAIDDVQIWVTHGPPLGHLDNPNRAGLTGCAVLTEKLKQARPLLSVFGHFHYSWGVEQFDWDEQNAQRLVASAEFIKGEGPQGSGLKMRTFFDFSGSGEDEVLRRGKETVFVNAAWMTTQKGRVDERNMPLSVLLTF